MWQVNASPTMLEYGHVIYHTLIYEIFYKVLFILGAFDVATLLTLSDFNLPIPSIGSMMSRNIAK